MLTLMSATDFGDLAARMSAGVAGVRACLILSEDGLSLAAHPADGEASAREAWDALQQIGDPQRGFVDMGEEIWVVSTRGAYAAIIVASPDAKPGVLLDRMEAQLLAAEQSRAVDAPAPPSPPEPNGRPRSPLHPEPRQEAQPEPVRTGAKGSGAVVDLSGTDPAAAPAAPPSRAKSGTVDRVALAREFGRLTDDESAEGY